MKLLAQRKIAKDFQFRRHEKWLEIYDLYRNRVKTNRLTQRQAVNIPLMKETIKTILSKVDDPPNVEWKEKSGDKFKELVYQEMWNDRFRKRKFVWKDIMDKKNVLLYGISTKMLLPQSEGVDVQVLDPYDIVFDPMMNPVDIETARFIIRQNIFRSVREVLADKRYSDEGKEKIKDYAMGGNAVVQSNLNKKEWDEKMARLKSMGVSSDQFSRFSGGDVILNLCEHYYLDWDFKKEKWVKRVCVYAQDSIELLNETLDELIGVDFWPFVVWSEDLEATDIYPDGVGDLVLVPNKVVNIWFSQQAENRTLQNFNMHWYDSTKQGYTPQTYEPGPGVMLPAPGNPNETIMPVEVGRTDETFNAINFVTNIVERATGATAIEKGVPESGQQTLGEVQILVGKAMDRATNIAIFYRGSWEELAYKWDLLMQANPPKTTKLYKTGRSGKMYEKVVSPKDWKSEAGYQATVRSSSEQEQEQTKTIQRFMFVQSQFPQNMALRKIAQSRELDILNLTPDELQQVEDGEKQAQEQIAAQSQQVQPGQAQVSPMDGQIQQQLAQLSQMQ